MKPLPISVTVISGAEASRIGRALESVAGWTSEIIVVLNAEVQDRTDRVAENFGAKVFREPWKGFVAQKNSAADKASQPWLLNLDADEVVSPELRAEIARTVSAGDAPHAAYEFPRCSLYHGRWIRHGDWYPDRVMRLWKKGSAVWAGEPHAALAVRGTVGRLHADLLHFTAESLNQSVAKIVRCADDFAEERARTGKPVSLLDLLARPPLRFVRGYVFRLGFLDGWRGFMIAWLTAFYTFLRYARAREALAQWEAKP